MPAPATQTTNKAVKFCYQCGRRTDGTKENCWYCGTYLHREVRPSKPCPFCGSTIPSSAIKCRHCGEFVDGRPRETPVAPPPTQVIYVVDRTLLGGPAAANDYRLLPGQPVPPEVARQLSAPTLRAIEQNRPELIDQPGVRLLAAPARDVIEIEAEPARAGGGGRELARRGGATSDAGGAGVPARMEDSPQRAGSGGMLGRLGRWLLRTAPGRARPKDEIPEAVIEDRFRICENCQTEILTTDNYCYHCGFQYHATQSDIAQGRFSGPSTTGMLLLVIVLIGGIIFLGQTQPDFAPWWLRMALAGTSLILCAAAFFAKRTSLNQIASIVLAIATAVAFVF